MSRARGANAILVGGFEPAYGQMPSTFVRLPFVTSNLGAEQGLIASDLLGYGREPQDPTEDPIVNDGDLVVPVDVRNFGYWLKLLMGASVDTAAAAAGGSIAFTGQPAANSTVTINGTPFTFVAGTPSGNQVQIGANLAATLTALATALNASVVTGVALATYAATATSLTVTNKLTGVAGNGFTLAAGVGSTGTPSGARLTGGAVSHVFRSGLVGLPSMSLEIGQPEVPAYGLNFGAKGNSLRIALARSGLLNATIGLICQGETTAATSAGGDPTALSTLAIQRFPQAIGSVTRAGAQLGNVVSSEFTYSNNLDKAEVIRPDQMIDGADEGMVSMMGSVVVRFADTILLNQATSGQPVDLTYGWDLGGGKSLMFSVPRVFLPRVKRPITGPGGIQATFAWQASGAAGPSVTATLINDVASY